MKKSICFMISVLLGVMLYSDSVIGKINPDQIGAKFSDDDIRFVLKNIETRKKYCVSDDNNKFLRIIIEKRLSAPPHAVFQFQKNGKMEFYIYSDNIYNQGVWKVEKDNLMIKSEMTGNKWETYGIEYYQCLKNRDNSYYVLITLNKDMFNFARVLASDPFVDPDIASPAEMSKKSDGK